MGTVTCKLLGYPTFSREGEAISGFISNKALLLGCYLVMHPHKTHGREVLATYFWGDSPDSRARPNLRQALHNLQKLFPAGFEVTRQTVAVMPDYFVVDVAQLAAVAAAPEDASDPELLAAVGLVAGEFLEGLYGDGMPGIEDWLRHQRDRCRQALLLLLSQLAERYRARHDWPAAEGVYRRMTRVDAWHEAAYTGLAESLLRQGRPVEALRQVQATTALLERELGLPPGPALARLEKQSRFARRAPRHNLGPALSPFVERGDALAQVLDLLQSPEVQLVTVVGLGGSGKTRLAQQAARQLVEGYINGVAYVSLSATDHAMSTLIEVLIQDGFIDPIPEDEAPLAYLRHQLAGLEMLLVVDNFEHLLEQAAELERLLEGNDGLKLLVTSRVPLNLRRERLVKLNGMPYPTPGQPVSARAFGALALFEQTARHTQPGFQLDDDNRPAAVEICQLVEGMPLAVELAAAWVDVQSLPRIAADIRHNIDALHDFQQDRPARHQSIRASFDHSWSLLAEDERALLSRLAIFAGEFAAAAAEDIAGAKRHTLKKLVNKLMLWNTAPDHFRLHDLLRVYSREALAANPALYQATAARHADYFLGRLAATQEAIRGHTGPALRQQIGRDIEDIRRAWGVAIEAGRLATLAACTWPVMVYFLDSHLLDDGLAFFSDSLDALGEAEAGGSLRAAWRFACSQFAIQQRQLETARHLAQHAAETAQAAGDEWGLARADYARARIAAHLQDDFVTGVYLAEDSLARAAAVDDLRLTADAHFLLGDIKNQTNQEAASLTHYDTARQTYEALGDLKRSTDALARWAYVRRYFVPASVVRPVFQRCLAVYRELEDRVGVCRTLYYLGGDYLSEVEQNPAYLGRARATLSEALAELSQFSGQMEYRIHTLRELAVVEAIAGDFRLMQRYLGESMALAGQLRSANISTLNLARAGLCLLLDGEIELCLAALAVARHHPQANTGGIRQVELLIEQLPAALQTRAIALNDSPAVGLDIAQGQQSALAQQINLDPAYLAELIADMAALGDD